MMNETALLIYENGLSEGQEVDVGAVLSRKPAFILGSDARCQLTLLDPQVSPSHATINFNGEHYVIKPTLPRLAVYVSGALVEHVTTLRPGDRVQVGDTVLHFEMAERESAVTMAAIKPAVMPTRPVTASSRASIPEPRPQSEVVIQPVTASVVAGSAVNAEEPAVYFPAQEGQGGVNAVAVFGSLTVVAAIVGFLLVMVGNLNAAGGSVVQSIPVSLASGENATLIMFEASWCTYCAQQKPIVNRLEREYVGLVNVRHVDVDDFRNRQLVAEYGARSVPMLVVMDRNRKIIAVFRGLQREETLRQALEVAIL